MDVLLLGGYRPDCNHFALRRENDNEPIHLDKQIHQLQELGLNPIVILSGSAADHVILKSRKLPEVDLVFDTNDLESNLFTNTKAGLHMVSNTAFALPLEVPCPTKEIWTALRREFQSIGFSTKVAVLQLKDDKGAPWHWGFPIFLTRLGRHLLLNDSELTSLTDPKLTYHYGTVNPTQPLAPQGFSL